MLGALDRQFTSTGFQFTVDKTVLLFWSLIWPILTLYGSRSTFNDMIRSFANSRTRPFYDEGKATKFCGMDIEAAEDLLAALDAATALNDLSPLKSVGLQKLTGNRSGQWAMTVNGPWRICFRFKDGDAYDVEITDYHRG